MLPHEKALKMREVSIVVNFNISQCPSFQTKGLLIALLLEREIFVSGQWTVARYSLNGPSEENYSNDIWEQM